MYLKSDTICNPFKTCRNL